MVVWRKFNRYKYFKFNGHGVLHYKMLLLFGILPIFISIVKEDT